MDQAAIDAFVSKLDVSGAAADEVTKSLKQLAGSATSAADAEKMTEATSKKFADALKNSANTVGRGFGDAGMQLSSMTSQLAASGAAFTAILPVMDMVHSSLKAMTEAFALGAQAATAWIPKIGESMGKLSEKTAVGVNKSLDIMFGAVKQQINGTQQLANSYMKLAQTGLVFGGSMVEARNQAAEAGMSLETFSSFASKNAAALAELGGNAQTSALNVAAMGKKLGTANQGLLAIYGGFENLNSALVDYMAGQARLGVDQVKNQKELEAGAKAYLLNQKELSNLTGKSAEALKKEQEERAKSAAYQMRLSEMSLEERQNTETALSRIRTTYGENAYKYAMEVVANNGEIYSEGGNKFRAFMGAQSTAIDQILANTGQTEAVFKQTQAQIMESSQPGIEAQVKSSRDLLKLQQSGYLGDFGAMLNENASAVLASSNAQKNASKAQAEASQSSAEASKRESDVLGGAIAQLENFKIKMEGLTVTYLPNMEEYLKLAYDAAEIFAKGLTHVNTAIEFLIGKIDAEEFAKRVGVLSSGNEPIKSSEVGNVSNEAASIMEAAAEGAAEKAAAKARATAALPVNPNMGTGDSAKPSDQATMDLINKIGRDKNANKRADGGLAYGPTLTGEDGAEAHIPLKGGNIPLKIDFGQMIQALDRQSELTAELITHVRDSKDVQERILNASY